MQKVMVMALGAVLLGQGLAVGQSGSSESYSERYASSSTKTPHLGELVDINRATAQDLAKLPGMTKVWADRVIKFRPYKKKTELLENGILPDRVYDKMKDFVIAHKVD
jgi:DNA uptake protein ComE-like DNA-binding protein